MPRVPISNRKRFEIIRLWLIERLTYDKIREVTDVSLGKISQTVNNFKRLAKTLSLEEAARIYSVEDEVQSILGLSEDLKKAGVSMQEARRGAKLYTKLNKLGVSENYIEQWIKFCRKISPPSYPIKKFTSTIMRISELEEKTGLNYEEIASSIKRGLARRGKLRTEIHGLEARRDQLNEEVKTQMTRHRLTLAKIDRFSRIEKELAAYGISLEKLEQLLLLFRAVEEVSYDPKRVVGYMTEVESLEGSLARLREGKATLKREIAALEGEVKNFKNQSSKLSDEVESLRREIAQLEKELTSKSEEYDKLMGKVRQKEIKYKGLEDRFDLLLGKSKELELVVSTLQNRQYELVNNIARYKLEFKLVQAVKEGILSINREVEIPITCPVCSKKSSPRFPPEFMTQLVRNFGFTRLGPIYIPHPLPPGSTTVQCPNCGRDISITYEEAIKALRKKH